MWQVLDTEWPTDIWHVTFFQSRLGLFLICKFWAGLELELITLIFNGDNAPLGSINVRELNLTAYLSFICHPYLCFYTSAEVLENNSGGEVVFVFGGSAGSSAFLQYAMYIMLSPGGGLWVTQGELGLGVLLNRLKHQEWTIQVKLYLYVAEGIMR